MYVNLEGRSTVEKYTEMIDDLAKTAHGGSVHSNRNRMSVASVAEPPFPYSENVLLLQVFSLRQVNHVSIHV